MILGIDVSQANRKIRSGTEWYAFYLINEFKKLLGNRKDIQVRLYTRNLLQDDLAQNLPENFEVKILHWPFRFFWGQIRLSWEMLINPPDILFCPAHTIPLRHPRKTFTTLHDVGFEDYPELYDFFSRWYHHFAAKLAVNGAYHIFTVSEFSKERLLEVYGLAADKVMVTYLGLDKEEFGPLSRDGAVPILRNLNLDYGRYLLFLGRLEPKKNILGIVRAYEQLRGLLPSPPVLVLGGKPINLSQIDDYLAPKPELKAGIKFLGYIRQWDKRALYAGAAVFVFPTLYEGFGLPILEAQACGVPVVTSNTASNAEIAGGGAVIVDPESPYEIAKAIKELLENEKLREEKVRSGFENLKRFAWEQTAKFTLEKIFGNEK